MIFTGTYQNKVDAKGRTSVPAPFRALIQESKSRELAIFPSFRFDCLECMVFDTLTALAQQGGTTNLFAKGAVNPYSVLFRCTQRVQIDNEGRITLPEAMVTRAGLRPAAVFTGEGHSFQIWSPAAHEAQTAEDMALLLQNGGLDEFQADFAAAAQQALSAT